VISVASAGFTYVNGSAAMRQAGAAERQTSIAEKALDLAKQSASSQAGDMERARKSAERSASAAEESKDIARDNAEIARSQLQNSIRLFHLDQRARVVVAGLQMVASVVPDQPTRFSATILNSGKTPAIRVHSRMWIYPYPTFPQEPMRYSYTGSREESEHDLGPGIQIDVPNEITLNKATIDAMDRNVVRLWVYGLTTYRDVFNPDVVHTTKWCGYYPSIFGVKSGKQSLETCSTHNTSN
jgi:hypothetical protein